MPTVDIRQRAIALIEQLSSNKLEAVVQLLEVLAEPSFQDANHAEEARLLETIQRRLPESNQTRLAELRDRCAWCNLSEAEHGELIHYEDLLEQHRVERLEALIRLVEPGRCSVAG